MSMISIPWSELPPVVEGFLLARGVAPGTQVYFSKRKPDCRRSRNRGIVDGYLAALAVNGGRRNQAKRSLAAQHELSVRHLRRILAQHGY